MKNQFLQELSENREIWIQALWAHQAFSTKDLVTVEGEKLTVEFPGWFNRGVGPDFLEARVMIENTTHYGSIEVHKYGNDWYSHQHNHHSAYNQVILHCTLFPSTQPVLREDGTKIPELALQTFLPQNSILLQNQSPQELLKVYDELPGRCGLALPKENSQLRTIVIHAAEKRIQKKANVLLQRLEKGEEPEQVLFERMMRALGYHKFTPVFEELARTYPIAQLDSLLRLNYREARKEVLARWFGACRLLESRINLADPTLRKEYEQLRIIWKSANSASFPKPISASARPQNSPERRLVGMFHHLYRCSPNGVLRFWLQLLQTLDSEQQNPYLRKSVLQKTASAFATPDWEPWQTQYFLQSQSSSSSMQLIGQDRQIIVWANTILPFFLAYARFEKWESLEQLLYQIFLILPAERSNQTIRFMEKRLSPYLYHQLKPRSLRIQQGLLQIAEDFCHHFEQGCERCELLSLI